MNLNLTEGMRAEGLRACEWCCWRQGLEMAGLEMTLGWPSLAALSWLGWCRSSLPSSLHFVFLFCLGCWRVLVFLKGGSLSILIEWPIIVWNFAVHYKTYSIPGCWNVCITLTKLSSQPTKPPVFLNMNLIENHWLLECWGSRKGE